jgi:hypothetical protein
VDVGQEPLLRHPFCDPAYLDGAPTTPRDRSDFADDDVALLAAPRPEPTRV